jgi:hypothetical protein
MSHGMVHCLKNRVNPQTVMVFGHRVPEDLSTSHLLPGSETRKTAKAT